MNISELAKLVDSGRCAAQFDRGFHGRYGIEPVAFDHDKTFLSLSLAAEQGARRVVSVMKPSLTLRIFANVDRS